MTKWVSSCRLAMKKGNEGGDKMPRRKKSRAIAKVRLRNNEGEQSKKLARGVAPYSSTHTRWMAKDYANGDGNKIVEY